MFTRSGCFLASPKSMISFCFSCSMTSTSSSSSSSAMASSILRRSFSSFLRSMSCWISAVESLDGSFKASSISSNDLAEAAICASESIPPAGAPPPSAIIAPPAIAPAGAATIAVPASSCPTGTPVGIASPALRFTSFTKAISAPAPSNTYSKLRTTSPIMAFVAAESSSSFATVRWASLNMISSTVMSSGRTAPAPPSTWRPMAFITIFLSCNMAATSRAVAPIATSTVAVMRSGLPTASTVLVVFWLVLNEIVFSSLFCVLLANAPPVLLVLVLVLAVDPAMPPGRGVVLPLVSMVDWN